ncbi:MAG: phosphoglucomutase/phosphomannomutase family protein [Endomicrobiales bacterium]
MIKFGTSGWRGIIADDFTFANVRLVTQAISHHLNKQSDEQKKNQCAVIVGYDTRFLSEHFARAAAEVLAANSIRALLCRRDTPTPVIAFEILRRKTDGGINFTASHNPPVYNGIKFSPSWGGPALPETTKAIEKYCREIKPGQIKVMGFDAAVKQKLVEEIDPRPAYLKRIKELVNFKAIKKYGLKVGVDVLNGTAAGYLDARLEEAGVRQKVNRTGRDVLFGGHAPEPSAENLEGLRQVMKKESCHLGLATDGDADRFGILDSDGTYINPNEIIALLLYHLLKTRKWSGVAARSVMTTHLVDRVAENFGIKVKVTPVGFKFIGEIMVAEGKDFIMGGEESGGLTIRSHVPEKDGILACLLVAEMAAMSRKPLRKILEEIAKLVGPLYNRRLNFYLRNEEMEDLRARLSRALPKELAGLKVKETITIDGFKFILSDGSWLGIRLSGTEPVVRLYLEAESPSRVDKLTAAGRKLIKGS